MCLDTYALLLTDDARKLVNRGIGCIEVYKRAQFLKWLAVMQAPGTRDWHFLKLKHIEMALISLWAEGKGINETSEPNPRYIAKEVSLEPVGSAAILSNVPEVSDVGAMIMLLWWGVVTGDGCWQIAM
jgi:hypothetical protein